MKTLLFTAKMISFKKSKSLSMKHAINEFFEKVHLKGYPQPTEKISTPTWIWNQNICVKIMLGYHTLYPCSLHPFWHDSKNLRVRHGPSSKIVGFFQS